MKKRSVWSLLLLLMLLAPAVYAQIHTQESPSAPTPTSWHAQTLLQAVGNMLIFAFIGILTAVAGFKIFDKCTPGDLSKEIIEHKNVAAAIVGGAVILGVCIIIAAAMVG